MAVVRAVLRIEEEETGPDGKVYRRTYETTDRAAMLRCLGLEAPAPQIVFRDRVVYRDREPAAPAPVATPKALPAATDEMDTWKMQRTVIVLLGLGLVVFFIVVVMASSKR